MSTLDLDAIRTDAEAHAAELPPDVVCCVGCHIAVSDVPALLAEVERLRAVNTAGENLADAVEDLLFTEGEHRQRVRDAWQRYVEVADTRAAVSTPDGTPTDG